MEEGIARRTQKTWDASEASEAADQNGAGNKCWWPQQIRMSPPLDRLTAGASAMCQIACGGTMPQFYDCSCSTSMDYTRPKFFLDNCKV